VILASKIRTILLDRILTRPDPKISYTDIATMLEVAPRSKALRTALWLLVKDDYDSKRPIMSILVVREDTKLPGQGFWIALCDILTPGERRGFNIEEEYKKFKEFYGGNNEVH